MAIIPSHPKSLWPGVKAWWGRKYNEHKKEYVDLFETDTSRMRYEEDVQLTGFGLAAANPVSTPYDTETQGYTSRYTHVEYMLGYIVTRKDVDDSLYMEVSKQRVSALAFSFNQTKETVAANVYNRAFNSSYTGGDGKELCATDHPSSAGTWANELTTSADLSETALEDLLVVIMTATNDRGLKINLMPEALIVPPALWYDANRIVKSDLQNDTANNAVNVIKLAGTFPQGVKLNHYLSDSDAYFIRTNAPRGLIHYQRVGIEFDQDNDFDTHNLKARGYERYSFGWTDPRALYSSPGA
jgi:hypothetical protein